MKYIESRDAVDANSPGIRILPPLIFLSCLFGGISLELVWPWATPLLSGIPAIGIGAVVVVAGYMFMMKGHNLFKSLKVTVMPTQRASKLVAGGAYRFSRNPMYVGMISILAGLGIAANSVWMIFAALIMAAYLSMYVVPKEEAYLAREFGDEYIAFCKSVRRWL